MNNLNCISHWFPLLRDAGLPVPRTEIVRTDVQLIQLLDGQTPEGWEAFLAYLTAAAEWMGLPCFLRTGQTSNKHNWIDTCYLTDVAKLPRHVGALVGFSEICDMLGLPTDVWAVRELLPTTPACHVYRGMPVNREFRCFVDGGEVVCVHPYWPKESLVQGFPFKIVNDRFDSLVNRGERHLEHVIPPDFDRRYACLCNLPANDAPTVRELAARAGQALGGYAHGRGWSVDVLETTRGWFVTDVAEAGRSFHWEGCPNAARFH